MLCSLVDVVLKKLCGLSVPDLFQYLWQNMLQTGLIVGGWDKYEGGKIYGIPLGGTVVEQPFAIGGLLHSRNEGPEISQSLLYHAIMENGCSVWLFYH